MTGGGQPAFIGGRAMESLYTVKLGELIKKFNLEVLRGAEGYEDQAICT